jgi:hypothetical protein
VCVEEGATYARAVTAYGPAQKDGAGAALWVGGRTVYASWNVVTPLGLAVLACGRGEPPMHVQSLRTGLQRIVQQLLSMWVAVLLGRTALCFGCPQIESAGRFGRFSGRGASHGGKQNTV